VRAERSHLKLVKQESADADWLWWHEAESETDGGGRRVFRFHLRFMGRASFDHVDVLLAASFAETIAVLSDSMTLEVDHVELYLRPDDAFRLGYELSIDTDWPRWTSPAEVVDGEPDDDADLTVVLVGH
jgi:hypothetical protein